MSKSSTQSHIDDLTYDVVAVLHEKAKALAAYDKYLSDADAEGDEDLKDLFLEMRKQDQDQILILKEALARRLDEELGYDDELDEEDDELDIEDYEEGDELEVEEPASTEPVHDGGGDGSRRDSNARPR